MANNIVSLPIQYFPDPTKGRPVFNGSIFIGEPNLDPEVEANRKTVTLRQQDGTEVVILPNAQPLRTGSGGVILYNGSAVQILTDGNYSIKVLNSGGTQLYYVEDALNGVPVTEADVDLLIANQTYLRFNTVTDMIASTTLVVGNVVRTAGYDNIDDGGGNYYQIVSAATGTADGGRFINLNTLQAQALFQGDIARAEQFGVIGNNSGAPYSDRFINLMEASVDFAKVTFPNTTIYFDNTAEAASFQSNCIYQGGRNTIIQPTFFTQRIFLTQEKTNFQIENLKSYVNEGSGGEDDIIGGGYWRFESCTNFSMNHTEVSRSFAGGFKFSLCSNFTLDNTVSNYNLFTGLELEGCSVYKVTNYDFSYNGRYSSDNSYKPLPTGWTGTHSGRGWTAGASGDVVDQKYSRVSRGQCLLNSEYGIRAFTASTKGVTNLYFDNVLIENSGAPAGTYGTVILPNDKGVDILINSDASGASDNIQWDKVSVNRTFGYGTAITVDGNNHRQNDTQVILTGDAQHVVVACAIFGGVNFTSSGLRSNGALYHYSFGSGLPESVTLSQDIGENCVQAINGGPAAGNNYLSESRFVHRSVLAIAGEVGMNLSTISWNINDTIFDSFFFGLEVIAPAPVATVTNCTTIDSVDVGFFGTPITTQDNLIVESNSFDSAFPGIYATFINNRRGGLNRNRTIFNSNPASGGTNAGALINWGLGDEFWNSAGVVGQPKGWICTTAGTPGTWTSTGNL